MTRPTVYLSNWASDRTPGHHGPGRRLTIMAHPRQWEHGDGRVEALVPMARDLMLYRQGVQSLADYRARYDAMVLRDLSRLAPGQLLADCGEQGLSAVHDGDTLCCGCSRDDAAAGRCHRVWAAHALARAGWRVVLDGEDLVEDGPRDVAGELRARLVHARAILHELADLVDDLVEEVEDHPELHGRLLELRQDVEPHLGMACEVCGCTELDACPGGCGWAADHLCTSCATGGTT